MLPRLEPLSLMNMQSCWVVLGGDRTTFLLVTRASTSFLCILSTRLFGESALALLF